MLGNLRYRFRGGERGTALIEFALVLPVLVVLTFLVADFGRAFYVKNLLDQAAREGARRMAVGSSATDAASITKYIAALSGMDSTQVTVTPYDQGAIGGEVSMTITTQFNWLYPALITLLNQSATKLSTATLTGTCAMRREY